MILPKSQQIQPSGQLLSFIADKDLIQATDKLMSAIMTAKNRSSMLIGLPSTELTGSDYFDELFDRVYTAL